MAVINHLPFAHPREAINHILLPAPFFPLWFEITITKIFRYDFAVFGFFSDEISRVFFPPQEGNAGIVESFTVFGLAFLMRPGEIHRICNFL